MKPVDQQNALDVAAAFWPASDGFNASIEPYEPDDDESELMTKEGDMLVTIWKGSYAVTNYLVSLDSLTPAALTATARSARQMWDQWRQAQPN